MSGSRCPRRCRRRAPARPSPEVHRDLGQGQGRGDLERDEGERDRTAHCCGRRSGRSSPAVKADFGGERGPSSSDGAPDRAPDWRSTCRSPPQQALLYRLCGDRNPLHSDPEFAAAAGFHQPILHGLCTYGMVCKAITDAMLDGDATAGRRLRRAFRRRRLPRRNAQGRHLEGRRPLPGQRRRASRDNAVVLSGVELVPA